MGDRTVTDKIAGNMAVAVKQEKKALERIKKLAKLTVKRYNKAAEISAIMQNKLNDDPQNEALIKDADAAEKVRKGLYATLEYLRNIYKQYTGESLDAEPVRKAEKKEDWNNVFATIAKKFMTALHG